jgi:hypothetical protein
MGIKITISESCVLSFESNAEVMRRNESVTDVRVTGDRCVTH